MAKIDCVIIGHNTGNFQDFINGRKSMAEFTGAYRDAQINSILLDGQRIAYIDLFNRVWKQAVPDTETFSPFDPVGLAGLHLASFLAQSGAEPAVVGEFQKGRKKLEEILRDEPLAVAITTTFYFEPSPMKEIVSFVRERSPNTVIIIGGPYPSHLDRGDLADALELVFEEVGADIYVIDSQGEFTLARVIQELKRNRDLDNLRSIPNLIEIRNVQRRRAALNRYHALIRAGSRRGAGEPHSDLGGLSRTYGDGVVCEDNLRVILGVARLHGQG